MQLTQVREQLSAALTQFGTDPAIRRAFIHSIGAIDTHLGRPREWPNRSNRRQTNQK